ncbi:hypothetical protein SCA6_008986 [Theobroma cacao]
MAEVQLFYTLYKRGSKQFSVSRKPQCQSLPFFSIQDSGDHDMIVPFLATQAWIRALNYPIVDDWRPWMLQGQVAGEEGIQLSTPQKNVLLCLKGG